MGDALIDVWFSLLGMSYYTFLPIALGISLSHAWYLPYYFGNTTHTNFYVLSPNIQNFPGNLHLETASVT